MRTLRLDPHVHTEGSRDSTTSVDDVLAAAEDVGLDGIAVTDHDAVSRSLEAVERAPEYGLFAVPGVEISTRDGHPLALGVETTPPTAKPFGRTVDWVRDRGGVVIAPHPFRKSSHGVGRDLLSETPELDAVETFNACTVLGYCNRQARTFASRHGRSGIGSSDAHRAARVGDGVTRVHVDPHLDPVIDCEPVLEAIRAGRTRARGRRASPVVRREVRREREGTDELATTLDDDERVFESDTSRRSPRSHLPATGWRANRDCRLACSGLHSWCCQWPGSPDATASGAPLSAPAPGGRAGTYADR